MNIQRWRILPFLLLQWQVKGQNTADPSMSPTPDPLSVSPTPDPLSMSPTPDPLSMSPTPDPLSMSPTLGPLSMSPTRDPLSLFEPTSAPTTCGNTGSCSINPDPHYTTWDNSWYDFQGGCDQYAIDNSIFEVQIRTRPRRYYSTITQLAFKIKATGEVFRVHIDGRVENTIAGGLATYSTTSNYWGGSSHTINFGGKSYITVYASSYGISMQAYGCEEIFGGSEGMCGSFDEGGTLFKDGSRFNLSGNYQDDTSRSIALAANWQVPVATSLLWVPSSICDASSTCGAAATGATFTCDAVRRRLAVNPGCTRTCTDITVPQFREQCEKDVELAGDATWACAPTYVNPVIATDRVRQPSPSSKGSKAKAGKAGYVFERHLRG